MSKLTQGGQTSLHALRMNVSVLKSLLKCFLIFFLVFGGVIFYIKSDGKSLKQAHNYFQAKFISLYQADPDYKIHIREDGMKTKT